MMAPHAAVRFFVALLPSLLLLSGLARAQQIHDASFVPDAVLRLSKIDANVSCTQRESVVVNGTTPGPLLELTAGKTSWVRVYNDQTDANATIHWHGLSASVAPFSDGTPLASQWPIPPQHYFDYELHPNLNESGTYFYHSHVAFQAVSAAGPLIVNEPDDTEPPYQYDDERIFFVSELYNRTDESIFNGLIGSPFVWSGESESVLVNGHSTPVKNNTDDQCAPEVFEVEPSKTYRFRFIGGVALADIFLVLENHTDFQVVAADAGYTKPVSVDRIQIDSGQRFDVLLKTKSLEELSQGGAQKLDYWFQLGTAYRPTITTGYALLRYKTGEGQDACCTGFCYTPGTARQTKPDLPPTVNLSSLIPAVGDNTTNTWLEYALTPLLNDTAFPGPEEVTRRIYLSNVQVQLPNGEVPIWVSNHTWVSEPANSTYATAPSGTPYLVDIYARGAAAIPSIQSANAYHTSQLASNPSALYTGWDPSFNAYPAAVGEVLEIVLLNEAGYAHTFDVHPWHAHGGHYYDLGSGPGMYDPAANDARIEAMRARDGWTPARRDSTLLYRWPADNKVNDTEFAVAGWRAWRLRVEDAGVWMVHCHTLQHMLMGMQTVWVMGDAGQVTRGGALPESRGYGAFGGVFNGPPRRRDQAGDGGVEGYLAFGGAAYGIAVRAPVVRHHFGGVGG